MKRINLMWGAVSIEVRIRRGNTSAARLMADGHQSSYSRYEETRRDILSKY